MPIIEEIYELSTATVIYHSLYFTLQIRHPFILEFKKLLQSWLKLRQIKLAVFLTTFSISVSNFSCFSSSIVFRSFSLRFASFSLTLSIGDDFFYQLLTAHFFKPFHFPYCLNYNKSTTFKSFVILFQVWWATVMVNGNDSPSI